MLPTTCTHDMVMSWGTKTISWGTCTHDMCAPRHGKMGKCTHDMYPRHVKCTHDILICTPRHVPTTCTHDYIPLDTPMIWSCTPRHQSQNFRKKICAYRGQHDHVVGNILDVLGCTCRGEHVVGTFDDMSWEQFLISWGTQNYHVLGYMSWGTRNYHVLGYMSWVHLTISWGTQITMSWDTYRGYI